MTKNNNKNIFLLIGEIIGYIIIVIGFSMGILLITALFS